MVFIDFITKQLLRAWTATFGTKESDPRPTLTKQHISHLEERLKFLQERIDSAKEELEEAKTLANNILKTY